MKSNLPGSCLQFVLLSCSEYLVWTEGTENNIYLPGYLTLWSEVRTCLFLHFLKFILVAWRILPTSQQYLTDFWLQKDFLGNTFAHPILLVLQSFQPKSLSSHMCWTVKSLPLVRTWNYVSPVTGRKFHFTKEKFGFFQVKIHCLQFQEILNRSLNSFSSTIQYS